MQTERTSKVGNAAIVACLVIVVVISALLMYDTIRTDMPVPDTETLIRIARRDIPYNETMIQSTLQFADATDSLVAHYHPSNPGIVVFEGIGISSTEQVYKFKITVNWNEDTKDWEVWTRTWEPIDLNQVQ